ncbi:pyridine nucleotide-disulfide oxidoreductase, putative [Heliomicrobium modesticaldum Ice1]|uniref:Pyridine nucleotide-disulfide oxidoreductase, putative n=1 Tax=Heliobacterium modesticaldum (strain ATCC 51547 / Ice1) TaxID=498761 RepID=B0TCQ4_HELMI|nr:YpdA family putative bacillithiol disulfide reductase [Heliomicrobium modesticaldum]ABZ84080.1 pyridine nucleotide-disulfide oxidoreductase, putative [Heliomicrobium modesticaldum Ice1]
MYDIAVIGGGPCGLACAIEAKEHGLDCVVLEKGNVVRSVAEYPVYMVLFSTTDMLEIGGLPFISGNCRPTRLETVRYYWRAVQHFGIPIQTYREVTEVLPTSSGFMLHTRDKLNGEEPVVFAKRVVVATGCYDRPNLIGVPGEELPHVSHYYKEPFPYMGRRVIIVGGGNSAAEAALELSRFGALTTVVHFRGEMDATVKPWIGAELTARILKNEIAALFHTRILSIRPQTITLSTTGDETPFELEADFVFLMTGYRPNTDLLVQAGAALDASGFPVHNPLTMETTVPGLYVAGAISEGWRVTQANIEKGRFHGKRIIQSIDTDQ